MLGFCLCYNVFNCDAPLFTSIVQVSASNQLETGICALQDIVVSLEVRLSPLFIGLTCFCRSRDKVRLSSLTS